MSYRNSPTQIGRMASMSTARASVREFDDEHLMQEIKYADVFHSETPSNFERWQMVGLTAVPLKQDEDQQQQQQKQQQKTAENNSNADFNHNQPKGDSAEALMVYVGGSRSHPVAMVDDRRVRPYGMKAGEGAHYAPDGSEQMSYVNENGYYVVSLDGPAHGSKENKTRMASLRHVNKDMQTHKIQQAQQQGGSAAAVTTDQQQQQQRYPHEGKSVNTEVRCTKDRIEFRAGDSVVGYFEASSKTWHMEGNVNTMNFSEKMVSTTPFMDDQVSSQHNLETGATDPVMANSGGEILTNKVFVKGTVPSPPDMMLMLEQKVAQLEARIAMLENR